MKTVKPFSNHLKIDFLRKSAKPIAPAAVIYYLSISHLIRLKLYTYHILQDYFLENYCAAFFN